MSQVQEFLSYLTIPIFTVVVFRGTEITTNLKRQLCMPIQYKLSFIVVIILATKLIKVVNNMYCFGSYLWHIQNDMILR